MVLIYGVLQWQHQVVSRFIQSIGLKSYISEIYLELKFVLYHRYLGLCNHNYLFKSLVSSIWDVRLAIIFLLNNPCFLLSSKEYNKNNIFNLIFKLFLNNFDINHLSHCMVQLQSIIQSLISYIPNTQFSNETILRSTRYKNQTP